MIISLPKKDLLIIIIRLIVKYIDSISFFLIMIAFVLQATIFLPMLWAIAPTKHLLGFDITLMVGYLVLLLILSKKIEKELKWLIRK